VKSGRVPKPFYVSPRAPRWRLSEIVESVNACRNARIGERS
jgi:predicted DNA-binding transcriptional regulator AlpA